MQDLADDLTEIRVSVGPETFTPIKFHSMTVGPIVVAGRPRTDETVADTYVRLRNMAESMFATDLKLMTERHFADVKTVAEVARRNTPSE